VRNPNLITINYNPNAIGNIGILFLPLATAIILTNTSRKERQKWWLVFFSIMALLIFTFSRAALAGTFLTIGLFVVFFNKQMKGSRIILVPILTTLILFYFVWTMSVSLGVIGGSRLITQSSLSPAIGERWQWIVQGWEMIALHPWTGYGVNGGFGTHSGFTKAALEFGLIYFFMFCIPFIYIIRKSHFIARKHVNPHVRIFARGMFIAGLVAVMESMFNIILFSSGYAQVFWLFVGYLHLAQRDAKLLPNHSEGGTSVHI